MDKTQTEKEIQEAVKSYYNKHYKGVSNKKVGLELALKTHLCKEDSQMHLELVEDYLDLRNKTILDVGSGFGCFILAALEKGYKVWGVEIDELMVEASKKRLKIEGLDYSIIKKSNQDSIPFENNIFDVVTLFNVLEHTKDIASFIAECRRVLKKGGQLFIWGPNYLCLYEPHYEMFWIPIMPRSLAKKYLSIRGKKPDFLDSLNFTTPRSIEKILLKLNMEIENVGIKEWKEDIFTLNDKYRTQAGVRMLKLINKLHLRKLAIFMSKFGFYYPLKYIAIKK